MLHKWELLLDLAATHMVSFRQCSHSQTGTRPYGSAECLIFNRNIEYVCIISVFIYCIWFLSLLHGRPRPRCVRAPHKLYYHATWAEWAANAHDELSPTEWWKIVWVQWFFCVRPSTIYSFNCTHNKWIKRIAASEKKKKYLNAFFFSTPKITIMYELKFGIMKPSSGSRKMREKCHIGPQHCNLKSCRGNNNKTDIKRSLAHDT